MKFNSLKTSTLEKIESIELLRASSIVQHLSTYYSKLLARTLNLCDINVTEHVLV